MWCVPEVNNSNGNDLNKKLWLWSASLKPAKISLKIRNRRCTKCKSKKSIDGAWFILSEQITYQTKMIQTICIPLFRLNAQETKYEPFYWYPCQMCSYYKFQTKNVFFSVYWFKDKMPKKMKRIYRNCTNERIRQRTREKKIGLMLTQWCLVYLRVQSKHTQIHSHQSEQHIIEHLVVGHLIAAWKWLCSMQLFDDVREQ